MADYAKNVTSTRFDGVKGILQRISRDAIATIQSSGHSRNSEIRIRACIASIDETRTVEDEVEIAIEDRVVDLRSEDSADTTSEE